MDPGWLMLVASTQDPHYDVTQSPRPGIGMVCMRLVGSEIRLRLQVFPDDDTVGGYCWVHGATTKHCAYPGKSAS